MNKSRHFFRLIIVASFFATLAVILVWRMLDLTVLDRNFLQGQGNARSLRVIDIPAHRGMITDRKGIPLAVSTPVSSVWLNPKEFNADKPELKKLAQYIHAKPRDLLSKLNQFKNREFVYLQRQLPPSLIKKIEALKIPGLYFQREFKRYYPEADSAAPLLGFTNIDDEGLEGIELVYQDWLMGAPGKKRVVKDRLGRVIDDLGVTKAPHSGNDVVLSIDRRLQYIAYSELNKTIKAYGAKSGTVVVLDTVNGEILAMANAPSYNPNAREKYSRDSYRNRALTDSFEPGSVIKPFSIASALETGLFTPDSIIDTNPGWMVVQGRTVKDIHDYGVLDVSGILEHSSNVGVTKMVLASPPDQLINLLQRFGFGQRTESAYPGESDGGIISTREANPFVLATLGFGYGITVTALQLAKGYMVFANNGRVMPVTLLHQDVQAPGIQAISAKTAHQVLGMMESVVETGTGRSAKVPGYRVAGKTGTARIAGKNGYKDRKYTSSFVGIAPVTKPRFVVSVIIHEPTKNGYYATAVAGPLFAKVMSSALRIFHVPTDKPESLEEAS